MNVLYDYQIFSWQKYGGISRYFYEIARRVSQQESVYIFQGFNVNEYGLEKESNLKQIFSKKKMNIPKSNMIYQALNDMLFKHFSKGKNIDVFHPTYYEDTTFALHRHDYKLVVTVYDMIHEIYPEMFKHDRTAEKKAALLKKADGIIAISEKTKEDIIRLLNIDQAKIKVIYLANSLTEPVGNKKIIDEPYILYVGNRSGYKNFKLFMEAYAISGIKNSVRCVCFGGGKFSSDEQKDIVKLGIQDRIIQVSGDDKALGNLYAYATAFVYPSLYEGFGLPPLEAMHYGTPVLVGNVSCLPEVVGNAGFYFNPSSERDIADKIKQIIGNDDLKKKLITLGYERERLFSWDKCAKETRMFYGNILEG